VTAALMRPDGHVTWVGEDGTELLSQMPKASGRRSTERADGSGCWCTVVALTVALDLESPLSQVLCGSPVPAAPLTAWTDLGDSRVAVLVT
jgi:hypothetical protein